MTTSTTRGAASDSSRSSPRPMCWACASAPKVTTGRPHSCFLFPGISWLVLGYVVPWTAALGRKERPIVADANGTWFIWVVASQSVAIAAATLEPVFQTGRRELALLAVMSWSVGVFLYAAAGIFVSLRLMLYKFGPEELTPPHIGSPWVPWRSRSSQEHASSRWRMHRWCRRRENSSPAWRWCAGHSRHG